MTLTDLQCAAIDSIAADPQAHIAYLLQMHNGDPAAVVARAEAALDEIADRERAAGYTGSRDELAAAAFAARRVISAAERERQSQERLARLSRQRSVADVSLEQRLETIEGAMRALAVEAERNLRVA
jgi:hypothetical protein